MSAFDADGKTQAASVRGVGSFRARVIRVDHPKKEQADPGSWGEREDRRREPVGRPKTREVPDAPLPG